MSAVEKKHQAIFNVYSTVTNISEEDGVIRAFDSEGNNVEIDTSSSEYTDELSTLTTEFDLESLRVERNAKLAETDWVVTMHKELGTNIPTAMKTYRQALRDITDSATSLDDVTWPEKP